MDFFGPNFSGSAEAKVEYENHSWSWRLGSPGDLSPLIGISGYNTLLYSTVVLALDSPVPPMLRMCLDKAAMVRMETRAVAAEQMIQLLRRQIQELRQVAGASTFEGEIDAIKRENQQLRQQIQGQKEELIRAEVANGVTQVLAKESSGTVGTICLKEFMQDAVT